MKNLKLLPASILIVAFAVYSAAGVPYIKGSAPQIAKESQRQPRSTSDADDHGLTRTARVPQASPDLEDGADSVSNSPQASNTSTKADATEKPPLSSSVKAERPHFLRFRER